jgi:hypothetical protein
MGIYQVEYDGYYSMYWHDIESNALKRWFDNYKVDRWISFANNYEWLVVKEVKTDTKRKVRYICEIGDDGRGTKRVVIMDHTAPPAPLLTFAAKARWQPPPPKTPEQLRQEAEWRRMMAMGYRPVEVPKRTPRWAVDFSLKGMDGTVVMEYETEIKWVLDDRPLTFNKFNITPISKPSKSPPAPTHRRNI